MSVSNNSDPLVSIVVITYNSSKFILETLESAKAQTYINIELIICDDCSVDGTVDICRDWIETNGDRFVRTQLITVEKNTGIAPNCNRGIKCSKGIWIKLIAGDDILLENCISDYINFSKIEKNANIIVSNHISFNEYDLSKRYFNKKFKSLNPKKQLRYMIIFGSPILGAVPIIKKDIFNEIGLYDENYPFSEDFPFFIKATQNGYRIFGLDKFCVKYRIHNNSISNTNKNSFFIDNYNKYMREIILPLSLNEKMFLYYWHNKIEYYMQDRMTKTPYNILFIRRLIHLIIDPYYLLEKLYKFTNK